MESLDQYIAFDLEFNTVDEVEHLIQVSAVRFDNGTETADFDAFVYSDGDVKIMARIFDGLFFC